MRYGCPVLASRTSPLPEVGGDAALNFDPNSTEQLQSEILRCLGDSSLRERMSTAGRVREAGFSWEKCARDTLAVYRELA
jgi:glycosyltransferase involved in cell wall biosynthesis